MWLGVHVTPSLPLVQGALFDHFGKCMRNGLWYRTYNNIRDGTAALGNRLGFWFPQMDVLLSKRKIMMNRISKRYPNELDLIARIEMECILCPSILLLTDAHAFKPGSLTFQGDMPSWGYRSSLNRIGLHLILLPWRAFVGLHRSVFSLLGRPGTALWPLTLTSSSPSPSSSSSSSSISFCSWA